MRIRKSPVVEIIQGLIVSEKAGLKLTRYDLETYAMTGGNVMNVVNGMSAAKNAGLPLSFKNATLADSKGENIQEEIKRKLESKKEKEIIFE